MTRKHRRKNISKEWQPFGRVSLPAGRALVIADSFPRGETAKKSFCQFIQKLVGVSQLV